MVKRKEMKCVRAEAKAFGGSLPVVWWGREYFSHMRAKTNAMNYEHTKVNTATGMAV